MNINNEEFKKLLIEIVHQGRLDFQKKIKESKSICVYGAGNMFFDSYEFIKMKTRIDFICDSDKNKWGKFFNGILCISPQELLKLDSVIVVLALNENVEIAKFLKVNGIDYINHFNLIWDLDESIYLKKNEMIEEILNVLTFLENDTQKCLYKELILNRVAPELVKLKYTQMKSDKPQYLVLEKELLENEYIIDCGAYTGDTIELFMNEFGERIKKVYAFELDSSNFEKMKENLVIINQIEKAETRIFNVAVGNENKTIGYSKTSSMHSQINLKRNSEAAKMVRLDDLLSSEKITFIKMDIEGWELEALKGAETIIRKYKPKLAICLYHKLSDLWQIPNLIKSYREDYSFTICHHSDYWSETVLYAY